MLPIHDVLPQLRAALASRTAAVLVAPPGAGKTTVAPLALLKEPWAAEGRIVVLEPRRLAARGAAERMAATLEEPVGATVGLRMRMVSKVSKDTRVEVVTEGLFSRMILDDPGLTGVSCVIFDEFHERSLDADLGLALARDAQLLLRPDLRLLVMSATIDGAAVSRMLEDAPVVESLGRTFPVETLYLGRDPRLTLVDRAEKAVARALIDERGSILVFLPGQAEILRTAERLADRYAGREIDIAPLYGALAAEQQMRAIAPARPGRRKVVLATSIAETSLTIEGVRVVIDTGAARVPKFDPASGLTRLATVRVSRAAADQRRGRAGRTEPGVCYRLWEEEETRALAAFATPEILEADLSGLALDLARWGAPDGAGLSFLDPPPAAAFQAARDLLERLGAVDGRGAPTPLGERLSGLPLPPRLAHMVVRASLSGQADRAALVAALITERGLGGREVDVSHRLTQVARDGSARARDAKALASRWTKLAGPAGDDPPLSDGVLLAFAYPERVSKARGRAGEFRMATGRGIAVDPADPLARETWLAVGELGGGDRRDRILMAAPITEADIESHLGDQLRTEDLLDESGGGRIRSVRVTRLGELVVREQVDGNPDREVVARALAARVSSDGLRALPFSDRTASLRARAAFLRAFDESWPDLSDEALVGRIDEWLAPLLIGVRKLADLRPEDLERAVAGLVPWDMQRRLETEAPARWTAPTGNSFAVDYAAPGGPRVELRVQEVFGVMEHPALAGGRTRLTMVLLSPGHRPIQTTTDLPGFWRGSWAEVRRELRGRYPKHVWPEDPARASPTTRAKPRGT